MFIIIAYDLNTTNAEGKKRLRRVAKLCQNYGIRVQNSVFECKADEAQWHILREKLLDEIEPRQDSLQFYYLNDTQRQKAEHHGVKEPVRVDQPLIL